MEIIVQDTNTNIVAKKNKSVKTELQELLEEKGEGTLERYLAKGLVRITKEAMKPDIHGDMYEDFEVKLKAFNTLHKILNPKIGQSNINLGFFNAPQGPLKY